MQRTPIALGLEDFPTPFHPLLKSGRLYDSSCSRQARVYYIEKGPGFYLKTAPKGTLAREAEMTRFFHSLGLSAPVLAYESLDADWLLTERIPGEDCIHEMYLADPKRLSAATGELLRRLHSLPTDGCPIPDHTARYLATAQENYRKGHYDADLFPDNWGFRTSEEAWQTIEQNCHLLKTDTLLHGDYCLPNILLDNWNFTGFIDMDHGGVGDRHVDIFWGIWTLNFNCKTDAYRDRFLDAYGRDKVEPELLRIVAACEVFG